MLYVIHCKNILIVCRKLKEIINYKLGFAGSLTPLWKIKKILNSNVGNVMIGIKFMMERNNIVATQIPFLKKMHGFCQEHDFHTKGQNLK